MLIEMHEQSSFDHLSNRMAYPSVLCQWFKMIQMDLFESTKVYIYYQIYLFVSKKKTKSEIIFDENDKWENKKLELIVICTEIKDI